MAREENRPIQCIIKHHLGKLRESEKGWSREVNIVSWEGAAARLDIRDWSRDKGRSSKGLTFSRAEIEKLQEILSVLNLDIIEDSGVRLRVQNVQVAYESKAETAASETEETDTQEPKRDAV